MQHYILDTDHLSLYQRGHPSLKKYLLSIQPKCISITIISVEEMIQGRLAQIRRAKTEQQRILAYTWLFKTVEFFQDFHINLYDEKAEKYFQKLRSEKLRIGTQDLRIASIALSKNATVVTRNSRDFKQIPSLSVADWS